MLFVYAPFFFFFKGSYIAYICVRNSYTRCTRMFFSRSGRSLAALRRQRPHEIQSLSAAICYTPDLSAFTSDLSRSEAQFFFFKNAPRPLFSRNIFLFIYMFRDFPPLFRKRINVYMQYIYFGAFRGNLRLNKRLYLPPPRVHHLEPGPRPIRVPLCRN